MKTTTFIGLDISKKVLDWCLFGSHGQAHHSQCVNEVKAIAKHLKLLFKSYQLDENTVICAEYTGHYIYPLVQACHQVSAKLWLESGAEIKASTGVVRGKDDKIDAQRIAQYAHRFSDKMRLFTPTDENVEHISLLQREREMYVTDRAKYRSQLSDMKGFIPEKLYQQRAKRLGKLIKELDILIQGLEKQIEQLIGKDHKLARQYEIATSITGVGKQTAIETIIATKAFTKFDNARQFCCHIGTAPFDYTSGSSIRKGKHVSQRADKKLKSVFHMAALSAIAAKGEFQEYFQRKVIAGKNKMSIVNAIRSKLVHRIFALIRDNRLYSKEYENSYAAALA